MTIVGVAAAGLRRAHARARSRPLRRRAGRRRARAGSRGNRGRAVIGRLRPDATLAQAQAQLTAVAAGLHKAYPQEWTDVRDRPRRITVAGEQALRLPPDAIGPVTGFLLVLALTMGLVLLVACANVAGLLVARAADRRAEVAVRLSLGASRGRLVRQLLVEALLLAALAAAAGLALAQWMLAALEQLRPPLPLPVRLDFAIDGTVLAVDHGARRRSPRSPSAWRPALQATRGLHQAAEPARRPLPDRARRLPLRARAGRRPGRALGRAAGPRRPLRPQPAGLRRRPTSASTIDRVLVATVDPSMLDYSPERGAQLYDELAGARARHPRRRGRQRRAGRAARARLRRRPPPHAALGTTSRSRGEDMEVHFNTVGPGYLATLGDPAAAAAASSPTADRPGRRAGDHRERGLRRALLAGPRSAGAARLGRRRRRALAARRRRRRQHEVHRAAAKRAPPIMLLPFAQHYAAQAKLHVRTAGDPAALAPALRDAIRAVDPALPDPGARHARPSAPARRCCRSRSPAR